MAAAMRHAVTAGRLAHLAGRIPQRFHARAFALWQSLLKETS